MRIRPKVVKHSYTVEINLLPIKHGKKIDNISMIADFSTNNFEIVGLEIINLREQAGYENLEVEEYEGILDGIHWKITYDEYDMFYIGFRREKDKKITSYSTKGEIVIDDKMKLAKIKTQLKPTKPPKKPQRYQ